MRYLIPFVSISVEYLHSSFFRAHQITSRQKKKQTNQGKKEANNTFNEMVLHFNRKRWHNFAFCWKARNKIIHIFFNHLRSEHNWRVARAYQVVVRCDEFEWIFGMRVLRSYEMIYEKLFVMPPKCHNEIFYYFFFSNWVTHSMVSQGQLNVWCFIERNWKSNQHFKRIRKRHK